MKRHLPFLCLLGMLSLAVSCFFGCQTPREHRAGAAPRALSYLIVGFDDAAANTDVMLLLGMDPQTGTVSLVQLPRDTYVDTGLAQNKLNQVFSAHRALGKSAQEALGALRRTVEDVLGVPTEAAVGITLSAFRRTVELVGGVPVTLPDAMVLDTGDDGEQPLVLEAGEHILNGDMACRFVRHRSSYAMGDLGRMDMQKLFLSALLRTVRERIGIAELPSLCEVLKNEYICDEGIVPLIATAINHYPTLRQAAFRFATLPGEALLTDTGLSYYVLNRAAVAELLFTTFGTEASALDREGQLYREGDMAFENIYFDEGFSYRVYGEEDVGHLHVPRRR